MAKEPNPRAKRGVEKEKADKFIAAFRATRSVTNACDAIGVGRRTVYDWKAKDPEFAERWASALEKNIDDLEASAMKRATDGWEEPVFYKGEQVGTVRKYSDALTIFMLKANRREKYFLEKEVATQATADYFRELLKVGQKAKQDVKLPSDVPSGD